jgi:hypothetical protein
MNLQQIRCDTIGVMRERGWPTHPNLPLLDEVHETRTAAEVAARAVALNASVAAGYGFPKESAKRWLREQNHFDSLTQYELNFLRTPAQFDPLLQIQPNGLLMLAWALGKLDRVDLLGECPNDLVNHYPDLAANESVNDWLASNDLRSTDELLRCADILYMAHAVSLDEYLNKRKSPRIKMCLNLRERRRAVEWILGWGEWDEIALDT